MTPFEAREKLLAASCGYINAEKQDETDPHYGDQLDLCLEILTEAANNYVQSLQEELLK